MTFFAEHALFLTGPTASGKTQLALALAREHHAEILSMDAYAVYRGMDIGTAKPTLQERSKIPHHLIDLRDPTEDFSLAEYLQEARKVAEDVFSRGKTPLFVGGTPLYLKSLLFGLFESPPADETFRQRWQQQAQEAAAAGDSHFLHRKVQEIDPRAAQRLHPHDTRRLIRALEIFHQTGQPMSTLQTQFEKTVPENLRSRIHVLDPPREELHRRIEKRVDAMFEQGLLIEIQNLLQKYGSLSFTASQAVGYREVLPYLAACSRGEKPSLEALKEEIKAHTRQLAKRQCTWLRGLLGAVL
ncbi:MAG: tRNA (adenosine(37)-N6)-dimethylallyltransferase MiaA [Planctomycetia bacterium]|nr:tRNA (adenosine(37)-N6)-dimethylallyltransferase MiaA [Planctomycetia bacterium]